MSAPAAVKAAARIDWSALSTKLKPETMASVNSFRRRHSDLLKTVTDLREHQVTIDFTRYKSVLKNQKVVEEAERAIKGFRPATVDLSEQLRMVADQEAKAIAAAKKTTSKIEAEMVELKALLTNIETARPLEQMTMDDVTNAYPEVEKTVEKMVRRGQWRVPGYYEK
ncbi:hypothetical protein BSLG_009146 [Batrachochytrium salamandrivorans]|nr:hypothetical protein BSLG_009146 [Batrachochytrium salamandrivorans]